MSKGKPNNADLSIEERIKKAEKKLKPFFAALDEEKKKFLAEPIHQLAVSQVILERLSEEIAKGDVIELFENGKQKMRRENPALKSYNSTITKARSFLRGFRPRRIRALSPLPALPRVLLRGTHGKASRGCAR